MMILILKSNFHIAISLWVSLKAQQWNQNDHVAQASYQLLYGWMNRWMDAAAISHQVEMIYER
jgi:hypothetical protein